MFCAKWKFWRFFLPSGSFLISSAVHYKKQTNKIKNSLSENTLTHCPLFFFFPAQRQESLTKFELCSVPSGSFGVSFCLLDGRNPMGILGKLPILALGRPGSYKIFDGYILENILSFKVRPLFEFECICAKDKHCCRLKSIPLGVAEFSALQQVHKYLC